ncbi:hypothetical protein T492DRAFT_949523 [Pavlovales sp. CCMP2436]|nr:hypothetical protein T492DRAFT_949523 [Pavlovales sp. CCMP2436]
MAAARALLLRRSGVALAGAAVVGVVAAPLPEPQLHTRRRLSLSCHAGRVRVTLLGVHHASGTSLDEVRDAVCRAISSGRFAARRGVGRRDACRSARFERGAGGLPAGGGAEGRRAHRAAGALRAAARACAAGRQARAPGADRALARAAREHRLQYLHGGEMGLAANLAEGARVRVVCIDSPLVTKAERYRAAEEEDATTLLRALVAHVGHVCELRLCALARGGALHLDDHLAALRRFKPATYRAQAEERNAHMVAQLCALLGSLGAACGSAADREARDEPTEVLVLCGAAHLPGLHALLSREGWCIQILGIQILKLSSESCLCPWCLREPRAVMYYF